MAVPIDAAFRLLELCQRGELTKAEALGALDSLDDGKPVSAGLDPEELQRRLASHEERVAANLAERWRIIDSLTLDDLARGET